MNAPSAYPLSWPIGRKRTASSARRRAPWKSYGNAITVYGATNRLELELDRLGASKPVLSTDMELRLDGAPRSDRRPPSDPGAALYFKLDGKDVVLASDSYDTVAGNIAALAAHVEATRAIERYGVGTLEQMFRGFTALPPGGSSIAVNDWRKVLEEPRDLAEAETNYRHLASTRHPDKGGSSDAMAELNGAIAMARMYWSDK